MRGADDGDRLVETLSNIIDEGRDSINGSAPFMNVALKIGSLAFNHVGFEFIILGPSRIKTAGRNF